MKINKTVGRPGSWLDVRSLMDQAAREDAAELGEHGAYQPTLADDAARAYELFKIGVWHLEQDDPGEALRWLRSAVEQDIVEAEPLLEICLQAVESVPAGRDAHDDEHEAAAAERQVALSETEKDEASAGDADAGEATPIYDAVADGLGDIISPDGSIIHVKYRDNLQRVRGERLFGATLPPDPWAWGLAEPLHVDLNFAEPRDRVEGNNRVSDRLLFARVDRPSPSAEWKIWDRPLVVPRGDRSYERALRAWIGYQCVDRLTVCDLPVLWLVNHALSGCLLPSGGEPAAGQPAVPGQGGPYALDEVERRVAFLVTRGMSGVDIADELGITYESARAHFARACRKLGVTGWDGLRAALGSRGCWAAWSDTPAEATSGV